MIFFRTKKQRDLDAAEERFQQVVELVKDLDKREFNKLIDGIKLAWQGYDKVRSVQTTDEKEAEEVAKTEKALDFIEEKR